MRTISRHKYLWIAQRFHWATKEHFILWFTGKLDRHSRTEKSLPRLVKMGKLIAIKFGKRLIYTVPRRKNDDNYEHGLGCTECLVRVMKCNPGEIIPEHKFRGFNVVPEWGIKYKNLLRLFEFCTADNFSRGREMNSKITRYTNNLMDIEENFGSESTQIIFVADVPREDVQEFVDEKLPGEDFLFTDYESFLNVPIGEQMKPEIYIWGKDGKSYSLSD